MYSNNKLIRDVADVATQIMSGQQPVTEKLHPNQQQLDVHEPEKDELTADDFKKLRAKKEVKKEEVETVEEGLQQTLRKYVPGYAKAQLNKKMDAQNYASGDSTKKTVDKDVNYNRYKKVADKLNKEEVEELDEVKMADLPSTKVQGRAYGASKPEPHAVDVMKGPKEKELKDIEAEKKKKKFSEMVNLYQEKGLKSLSEMLVKEEPDNEQFTKELEDAKAKSEGKKRNTEIAKGAVQAVKQEGIEITDEMIFEVLENAGIDFESLDDDELQIVANEAYEILDELSKKELDEREMTDAEMKKREDIVKGMKKGMAGFKERYGDRAKNVIYATANKQAMKD